MLVLGGERSFRVTESRKAGMAVGLHGTCQVEQSTRYRYHALGDWCEQKKKRRADLTDVAVRSGNDAFFRKQLTVHVLRAKRSLHLRHRIPLARAPPMMTPPDRRRDENKQLLPVVASARAESDPSSSLSQSCNLIVGCTARIFLFSPPRPAPRSAKL